MASTVVGDLRQAYETTVLASRERPGACGIVAQSSGGKTCRTAGTLQVVRRRYMFLVVPSLNIRSFGSVIQGKRLALLGSFGP